MYKKGSSVCIVLDMLQRKELIIRIPDLAYRSVLKDPCSELKSQVSRKFTLREEYSEVSLME